MNNLRKTILNKICYTDLVYDRINKKLQTTMSKDEIEKFIFGIMEYEKNAINKKGKNYYVKDEENRVRVTINSYTYRVITTDKI